MKQISLRVGLSCLVVAGVALSLFIFIFVHTTGAQVPGQRIPMISDWSHRHVVFSQPHNFEEAWRLQTEPRYWIQILSRNGRRFGHVDHELESGEENISDFEGRGQHKPTFHKDWGQSLGAGGSTGPGLPSGVPVYPAKFSFDINAAPDCTNDYVVFPTNLAGVVGGQASVIAYNKLYAGTGTSFCGVANPAVDWSYDTNFDGSGVATTGIVQTSPVLSGDGSKIAFVETRTGGAILHLLKWHAGDGGAINTAIAPTIATVWTADGLAGHCPVTGSCLISIGLQNGQPDTGSSPFYDYRRDVIYVGDDNDVLHKIINAFGISGASPSEVLTGNWPIRLGGTGSTRLTSPILDSVSGNIFVADTDGNLSYVREIFSVAGTCSAPCLGGIIAIDLSTTLVHVITDAPIVDSVTGKVFVFIGNNGASTPVGAVVQSDITLSASVSASLGTGVGNHLHLGAFDNTYLTGNGSAGSLYMCGSSTNSTPTIQRIGFTNSGRSPASPFSNTVGTMYAAVDAAIVAVAASNAECSPVTELFNANAPAPTRDQIFFGVHAKGKPTTNCVVGGVAVGCVMSINVTGTPGTLTIANSIPEISGPSGIIVDNDANTTTFPQSSNLYFSNQGNSTGGVPCGATSGVGCAVKVTQSGLN
jgi:hypothetical protein